MLDLRAAVPRVIRRPHPSHSSGCPSFLIFAKGGIPRKPTGPRHSADSNEFKIAEALGDGISIPIRRHVASLPRGLALFWAQQGQSDGLRKMGARFGAQRSPCSLQVAELS